MSADRVAIIGPGRVGCSLARALRRTGSSVRVLGRAPRELPEGQGSVSTEWQTPLARAPLVLIAVPDDQISQVAATLAAGAMIDAEHVVLHCSGLRDRTELAPLEASGAALGSWHPLQTFVDPAGEPDAFHGTPIAVEGDRRAIENGSDLAARLGAAPVIELDSNRKAPYHAAAVMASNYLVVLGAVASRIARGTGARGELPVDVFLPIMRRSIENLARNSANPAAALTGPIRRGEADAVACHLAELDGSEREMFVALGREALRLAREAGLAEDAAARVAAVLDGAEV